MLAYGKLVFKKELDDGGSTKINLSLLPAVLYLAKLKSGSKTVKEKILRQ